MIIKQKENDMNHFNTAKKYINSNPSDYINSLKELNQISFLIQNISVMHMKVLCLLMLSKYEEIIECYYLNKKYFDTLFDKVEDNEEKIEIKKIIALAFYNFNGKQKAKQICPEIKDDYEHKIEKLEITFLNRPKNIENNVKGIESVRANRNTTLKNIKKELDKNIKKNTQKELKKISSIFIDDLFDYVKDNNNKKNLLLNDNNINEIDIIEEKKSLNSSGTNIYLKLKEEINNTDKIEKDDGNLITFEDKIKPIELIESSKENKKIEIQNKQENDELIKSKEKREEKKIKNNISNNSNNNNEINIYNNTNNNANSSSKEKNKKNKNLEIPRKSCNPLTFANPIEFTLCPGEVSLNNLSGSLINGESGDENLNSNNQKITVEVDDEQYIFVKNEKFINIDSNNNSDNYDEYININFLENRNRIKKKSWKLKNSKSLTINFDRKLEDFAKSVKDIKIDKQIRKANYKKTSVFKTNYILDNK